MIADVNGHFQGSVAFTDVNAGIGTTANRRRPKSAWNAPELLRNACGTIKHSSLKQMHSLPARCGKSLNSHTLHGNEAAARMLIDTVMQHAIDMGQRLLASVEELDKDICERHGLKMVKAEINNIEAATASWMLLHPDVKIDSQKIDGTEFQLHGALDYTVEVVQTDDVAEFVNSGRPLKQQAIYGNRRLSKRSTMSIMEAKADSTFIDKKTMPQVVSQGVAEICRRFELVPRRILMLADLNIQRNQTQVDQQAWMDHQAPTTTQSESRSAYSCTPAFTIKDPNNLAIVSKLILAATLGHPDDFAELARII
ncbi:hypothetical protein HMN09_00537900 [Mycena chlorophos]|uniref:Uncharacterized protein n=1 Tax=Mycena chlorophos TaxID=658473 RepID=A0A8H6TAD3_MYCCL|nr:hypothetical protein HMN09_00537900 [Mycena chlorophos]